MRILATVLFFSLSFVLFTSCTILILSYPRLTQQMEIKGIATKKDVKIGKVIKKYAPTSMQVVATVSAISPTLLPAKKLTLTSIKSGSTPTIRILPSPTPVPIKSTPTPSAISPTPIPSPTIFLKKIEATQTGGSFIAQINAYRASNGLGPVSTSTETCNFAAVRAGELTSDFSHNGFSNRIGSKSLPYSSYHEVTENIAMNSDASQIVNMWINSPGHAENMRKDTPFVCVAQNGNYFAYEGMRP